MNDAVDFRALSGGAETTMTPGERLAQGRQAQNLAPADIARQLKLSVWQIEALEAGQYRRLPGPIFVRGFIRNYARLVKLNPDEVLQSAGDSIPLAAARPESPPSPDIPFPSGRVSRLPVIVVTVVTVVGMLVGYEFYWNESGSTVPAPEPLASSRDVASPTPGVTRLKAGTGPIRVEADPNVRARSAAAGTAPAAMEGGVTPAAAVPGSGSDSVPRAGERQVRLEFGDESWVEIRDRDEKVIFSQLNRPGTRQFVNGLPPFSIVVGNAHGVQLSYGERPVDLAPHTKVDVARLILQ